MRPLRILLTNLSLSGRTGTEIVTRDIAFGLRRQGHHPSVYSPKLGPLATEVRAASIPVADAVDALGETPDVIHGHHNVALAVAIARFPAVPALFVCNDFVAWHDAAPRFPSIRRYVAIDRAVADRLTFESGIAPERVVLQPLAVDLQRFPAPQRALPASPSRALAFVKHVEHVGAVRAACEARGIRLDVAGTAVGRRVDEPERVLPGYDLVFTSALSALEAMVSGCAVIVCDARGLAGFVTPAEFERWRPYNFGLRTLTRRSAADELGTEIDRYDADAARAVTALARREANLDDLVERYVELYRACIEENEAVDRDAHDRATARHLERWAPRYGPEWPWQIERETLLGDLDAASSRPARLAAGETLGFDRAAAGGIELVHGFGEPEAWGVWTDGPSAMFAFRVDPQARAVEIALHAAKAFVTHEHPAFSVVAVANGQKAGRWRFRYEKDVPPMVLRAPLSGRSGLVVLELRIDAPRAPSELGISADRRALGIGLERVEVRAIDYAGAAS